MTWAGDDRGERALMTCYVERIDGKLWLVSRHRCRLVPIEQRRDGRWRATVRGLVEVRAATLRLLMRRLGRLYHVEVLTGGRSWAIDYRRVGA